MGLIAVGMWVQAGGLFLILDSHSFWFWLLGAVLLGIGTALVYPTLLAAVSDVAHPSWRASAVGVYRLWRDSGYAVGALLSGIIADLLGMPWAIGVVGALTFLSGVVVVTTMRETLPARRQAERIGIADHSARDTLLQGGTSVQQEEKQHAQDQAPLA